MQFNTIQHNSINHNQDEPEQEYAKEMSDNINKRLTKTLGEMKDRHASGTNELDDPDRAPTGAAYHAAAQAQKEKRQAQANEQNRLQETQRLIQMKQQALSVFGDKNSSNPNADEHNSDNGDGDGNGNDSDNDSSDGEYDDLLNETDDALEAIRQKRLFQMKMQQTQMAEHRSLGHGEVRTINQDEFLPECTGKSEWVAVHFYHDEFERCKIMDHHLKLVARLHLNCKFLRVDAAKAPFFVDKLQIQTLPTLIVFQEGKPVGRLMGFEGLAKDLNEPDKWHTGRLQQWLAGTGAIKYKIPTEEVREEMERMGIRPKGTVWTGTRGSGFRSTVYDSDDE
jgi:thiol-disulfide isomerase/thioredoxin